MFRQQPQKLKFPEVSYAEIGRVYQAEDAKRDIEARKRKIALCDAEKLNIETELQALTNKREQLQKEIAPLVMLVWYSSAAEKQKHDMAECRKKYDALDAELQAIKKRQDELYVRKEEFVTQKNALVHDADPEMEQVLNDVFKSIKAKFNFKFSCARNIVNNNSIITVHTPPHVWGVNHEGTVGIMFQSFAGNNEMLIIAPPKGVGAVVDEVHDSVKVMFYCDRAKVIAGLQALAKPQTSATFSA